MSADERCRSFELHVPSTPESLGLIRKSVDWLAEQAGLSVKEAGRTVLAAVEAATNIMRHAYADDPEQQIFLRGYLLPSGLELEFLDEGETVDPSQVCSRDVSEVRQGGLGVHLIETCMDEFEYCARTDTRGARLVLRKHRSEADS